NTSPSHAPEDPPDRLPDAVHAFLGSALDLCDDYVQGCWDAFKSTIWHYDTSLHSSAADAKLFHQHGKQQNLASRSLYPPVSSCINQRTQRFFVIMRKLGAKLFFSSDWQGYGKPSGLAGRGHAGPGPGGDCSTRDLLNKPEIVQNMAIHFLTVLDILGLVLAGKPVGLRVGVKEGKGTGQNRMIRGLPVPITMNLFTLEDGACATYHYKLTCPTCKTTYHNNYSVANRIRTYYSGISDFIEVGKHACAPHGS
ncbi:hypothetical protein CVT26_005309, partial [Gymnopilus dilepis]